MSVRTGAVDRKQQIVLAAIDRLYTVGFEGFRVGDVARDVGINNATLLHHYPSKAALIRAVVERFTQRFEAVAKQTDVSGDATARLAAHMRSSLDLMQSSPEMFVVLNEIMVHARRDAEIQGMVSVPLQAWKQHIVSLLTEPESEPCEEGRLRADEVATACMSQLLGMGLLQTSTHLVQGELGPFVALSSRLSGAAAMMSMPANARREEQHERGQTMEQFLLLYRGGRRPATREAGQILASRWSLWLQRVAEQGALVASGDPVASGRIVGVSEHCDSGRDYVEGSDHVGGYSVIRATDLDAAQALCAGCPVVDEGGFIEVRQILAIPPTETLQNSPA